MQARLFATNTTPRSIQVSPSPNHTSFYHSPQGVQPLFLVFIFKINKSLVPILQMKKICLWAYGGIWGGIKTKILETIQNTTSFLPQNLQPQISQNKNPKTNNTQVKTFLAQREEKAICFFLYSLSALLWTSGNVQCLQISHVTLNVFATPPELSWKKSLISKLEHQAEPKTYLRASVLSRDGGAGRVWDLSSNSVS